jgi:hypothetical protein
MHYWYYPADTSMQMKPSSKYWTAIKRELPTKDTTGFINAINKSCFYLITERLGPGRAAEYFRKLPGLSASRWLPGE